MIVQQTSDNKPQQPQLKLKIRGVAIIYCSKRTVLVRTASWRHLLKIMFINSLYQSSGLDAQPHFRILPSIVNYSNTLSHIYLLFDIHSCKCFPASYYRIFFSFWVFFCKVSFFQRLQWGSRVPVSLLKVTVN